MAGLRRYLIKKALTSIPLLFAVIVFNFVLIHIAPGDPAMYMAGEMATAEDLQRIREMFGLDKPLYVQLSLYLTSVLRGDLGYSYRFKEPVLEVIIDKLPATLILMGFGYAFAVLLGLYLGVKSSTKQYSKTDNVITVMSLFGYSTPVFWFGQMLMLVFCVYLNWFPIGGMASIGRNLVGIEWLADRLSHLLLPGVTVGYYLMATAVRMTRGNMLEVLRLDYIRTARSKGLSERVVIYKHALRNALLPVTTILGLQFGRVLAGAVMTETVFAWPGIGRLMYDSLIARDYPVILGILIIITIFVIVVNTITDIIYTYLDPRMRV